jgi:hypothetical protein
MSATDEIYCWLVELPLVKPATGTLWATDDDTVVTADAWTAKRYETRAEAEAHAARLGPLWIATDHIFIHGKANRS